MTKVKSKHLGNAKNLKPRTQEGFETACAASIAPAKAEFANDPATPLSKYLRTQIMRHGYICKVVLNETHAVFTSGTLAATAEI